MAFSNRKILVAYLPGKDFNLTISVPLFHIYPPPPPPPPQKDLSLLVTISICAAGSILLFLFLVGFLYHYITKSRPSSAASVAVGDINREEDEEEREERDFSDFHHVWRINTVGLHRSTIDSITVVLFKKGEERIDGTECSVCLNEFEEDESLRLLPKCSHAFHINCIDTWLLSHKNCPLCRAPVVLLHTDPTHQVTEVNHLQDSELRNDLSGGQVSSESRSSNILPRAQSDLSNHCGQRIGNARRSYSVGGSLSLCDGDNISTRSRSHFQTRFSTHFFSSSRRSRNNDQILPNRMPNSSGDTSEIVITVSFCNVMSCVLYTRSFNMTRMCQD